MTGTVFVDMGISLDGFLAGPNAGPKNPLGDRGTEIHAWLYDLKSFRERLELGEGGVTNADDKMIGSVLARAGAHIMGRRMFDEGEHNWPARTFQAPVFVLTHSPREPWVRPGGGTFTFVTEGVHRALELAKVAAGDRDIQISGGASTVVQFFNAGLIEELQVHLAPMLIGGGTRLFDGFDTEQFTLEPQDIIHSDTGNVTHLKYRVVVTK